MNAGLGEPLLQRFDEVDVVLHRRVARLDAAEVLPSGQRQHGLQRCDGGGQRSRRRERAVRSLGEVRRIQPGIDAEIPLIVCITEGIPVLDMARVKRAMVKSTSPGLLATSTMIRSTWPALRAIGQKWVTMSAPSNCAMAALAMLSSVDFVSAPFHFASSPCGQ